MRDELDARIRSLEAERLRPVPPRPQARPQETQGKPQPGRTDDPQPRAAKMGASETYRAAVAQLAELRRRAAETEAEPMRPPRYADLLAATRELAKAPTGRLNLRDHRR